MRQRQLLYLLTIILATTLTTGCGKDSVEEGSYDIWTDGLVITEAGDNSLFFVPTADAAGMMLTYDRTDLSYERLVQMVGGAVDTEDGGSGQKGLLTYQGAVVIPVQVKGMPVTAIDQYAFSGNLYLESVTIPESVTDIGPEAFAVCPSLTTLALPSGITEIKAGTFCGRSVSELYVPDNVRRIAHFAFLKNVLLTTIQFDTDRSQLEYIGASAFSGCTALTDFEMPEQVRELGDMAFNGCTALRTVTLGSKLQTIGKSVFSGCSKLTSIYMLNSVPPTAGDVISTKATIYIPKGSLEAYQQAPYWSEITNYVEEE